MFLATSRSNFMLRGTHFAPHLRRWNCGCQIPHAHQVVGRTGEGEDPVHFAHSAMAHFPQQGDGLQPTEAFFDPLPLLLAPTIASKMRGSSVNRAPAPPSQILRHMRRHSQMTTLGHEIPCVEAFVASHRYLFSTRNL